MRILFVTPYYKPYLGGVERVIANLAREFIECGHEVAVLTSKYSFPRIYHSEWLLQEKVDDVAVHRLDSWPKQALPFFSAPLTWFSPLEIGQIVKTYSPSVIIYMGDKWFWGNWWVRLLTRSAKHIWCPVFHDLTWAKQLLRPINWLFGCIINDVVVVTKLEAEKVRKVYGVSQLKIVVIPWGVDTHGVGVASLNLDDAPAIGLRAIHESPLQSGVTILSVGRISRHKGQTWLADRFIEAAAKTTVPCRLVLVGEIEEPTVVEEIRGWRDSRIVIDTEANDAKLAEYYQSADIFALFPEYESFGLVFLEAMSYGVPVLTHSVGAIKEVLGDAAVVAGQFDKEVAVSSLLSLINDVEHRKELGQRGQKYVQEEYSWKKCAEEFLTLMQSCETVV